METKVFTNELSGAAEILKNGGLVAVPTETVYGLAGNGLDAEAVERIYEVKGRPAVKPLSLMVPSAESMEEYCLDVPPQAKTLAARFWPGPLTIVLRAKETIPPVVLAGGDTVGLRCPDHPKTLGLLRLTGLPFAAPSANPSGEESPKSAEKVLVYFNGKIEGVVDGGPCGLGRESTLISLTEKPFRILRRGALGEEEIADALIEGMTLVGITGPSGSGKTTALRVLESFGALLIDCDALYHELLENDESLVSALAERFPDAYTGGGIDRRALAAQVFADPEELKALNEISHRFVREELQRRLRVWAMAGGTLAAIDAIELIESGLGERCDLVLGVLAGRQTRIARIMRRDGLNERRAAARVDAQKSEGYFKEKCDHVLYNNGDEDQFSNTCRDYFTEVLKIHG
ncbi:MAG: threonylcarbamoyl-AMP synthase [Oscillospiraceae bacterium]|nr:threonylcarbamoyl-AMP synthase [Oscillospiraceae bacterium]